VSLVSSLASAVSVGTYCAPAAAGADLSPPLYVSLDVSTVQRYNV
jgi:hypothetical protein